MEVSRERGAGAPSLSCRVCGATARAESVRTARVHSNVKRFADEVFVVWQCPVCRSIHAQGEVDLDHYYAHYPFHGQSVTFATRLMFRSKLRDLVRFGLTRSARLLDYGCGSGQFVQYLRSQGYEHARGYDAYVREGPCAEPPGCDYDFVLAQDVIEHVDDPRAFLETLKGLSKPGGTLVIGTPNAAVIELGDAAEYVHMLHQPYHRHILSREALVELSGSLGLTLVGEKHALPGNTLFPCINGRYFRRLLRADGDTLDGTLAGTAPFYWQLATPGAIWDALTGGLRDTGRDMTLALRIG